MVSTKKSTHFLYFAGNLSAVQPSRLSNSVIGNRGSYQQGKRNQQRSSSKWTLILVLLDGDHRKSIAIPPDIIYASIKDVIDQTVSSASRWKDQPCMNKKEMRNHRVAVVLPSFYFSLSVMDNWRTITPHLVSVTTLPNCCSAESS